MQAAQMTPFLTKRQHLPRAEKCKQFQSPQGICSILHEYTSALGGGGSGGAPLPPPLPLLYLGLAFQSRDPVGSDAWYYLVSRRHQM